MNKLRRDRNEEKKVERQGDKKAFRLIVKGTRRQKK